MDFWSKMGRLTLPWAMFAFPFYLWSRSPGKTGSHYDPSCDLFKPTERNMVRGWGGLAGREGRSPARTAHTMTPAATCSNPLKGKW